MARLIAELDFRSFRFTCVGHGGEGGDWDARETCGFAATCPFVRGKLVNGMYGFSAAAAAAHMHDETGTGRSDGGEGEYPREGSCIINITCAPIIRTPLRRRRRKSYRDEGKRKKGKKKSEKNTPWSAHTKNKTVMISSRLVGGGARVVEKKIIITIL